MAGPALAAPGLTRVAAGKHKLAVEDKINQEGGRPWEDPLWRALDKITHGDADQLTPEESQALEAYLKSCQ